METLTVSQQAMDQIDSWVQEACPNECMGLLASVSGSEAVTDACLLRATASASSAEAAPLDIKRCADALRDSNLVVRGLWHSHADFGVFHSPTDHTTIHCLLPAVATQNFQRSGLPTRAPVITGPDTALLPTEDNRLLMVTLLGAPIPEMEAHERVAWDSIETTFKGPEASASHATMDGRSVSLEGGAVQVRLGIPEGASCSLQKEETPAGKTARVYSLVVNKRQERCAECLVMVDVSGQRLSEFFTCAVEIVGTTPSCEVKPGNLIHEPKAVAVSAAADSRGFLEKLIS